ncbi:MAG: hypothetical protein ACRDGH_17475 [Candidatus Limnocylindria bacterium]
MAQFDVDAMLQRYRERAAAVKDRPLPPVAGDERRLFVERAQADYTDYALIGSASWSVEEGDLVLRIPLGGSS